MIYLPVTVLLRGGSPWFADWFIHLSLLAAQAPGTPASAPTNALFLLDLAAHTEGVGMRSLFLPSHLQTHPLGSASGGEVPGGGAGGGGHPWH